MKRLTGKTLATIIIVIILGTITSPSTVHAASVTDIFATMNTKVVEIYVSSLKEGSYTKNSAINFDLLFFNNKKLGKKVKNLFTDLPLGSKYSGKKYFHLYNTNGTIKSKNYYSSTQCWAFGAKFAADIFKMDSHGRDNNGDIKLAGKKITESTISYNTFKNNKIYSGSILRTTNNDYTAGHTLVILAYSSQKIVIAESNYDGKCTVRIAVFTWSNFRNYISKNGSRKINRIVIRKNYANYVNTL